MNELIYGVWFVLILTMLVIVAKYILPTFKYLRHIVLVVLILSALNFAYRFLKPIINNDDGFINPLPLAFMCLIGWIIYMGGRSLSYKTRTGIWDTMHNLMIGFLTAGDLKWVIPWLERTTTSTDGAEGQTLNMKSLPFLIDKTPEILTKGSGVRARVIGISNWFEWDDKDPRTDKPKTGAAKKDFERRVVKMFNVEGGVDSTLKRAHERVPQILHDRVGKIDPETLDADKGGQVKILAQQLKDDMNDFLFHDDSPFRLRKDFNIEDTELDVNFYNKLMEKEIAKITAAADDTIAAALGTRLSALGAELLKDIPGIATYTSAQRTEAAMIALQKIKKDITFKKVGIDPDSNALFLEMARILAEILGRGGRRP